MGRIAYNRDQRIANEIIDALIEFNDVVSRRTILRAIVAGKSAHAQGEYVPARVWAILGALVDFGAVTMIPANERIEREGIEVEEGVDVYFVDPRVTRKVLAVARGEFIA